MINDKLQEVKTTIKKAREYLTPDEKGDINYSKSDELVLALFDYYAIDWMVETIEKQQDEIDTLSMAHDNMHRLLDKDKHALIKSNISLNKRVKELEEELNGNGIQLGYKGMYGRCNRDYAELLEQNKRYSEAIKDVREQLYEMDEWKKGIINVIKILKRMEGEE